MDAPKVQAILSSKPIATQAAHDLLSRFLAEEHKDAVAEGGDDELLIRLDAVRQSLAPRISTDKDKKQAKKAAKKSAKKERKQKRKRENESTAK